jgi:hypothetical protein
LFPNCDGWKGHYKRQRSYGPHIVNKKSQTEKQQQAGQKNHKPRSLTNQKYRYKKSQTKKIGKKNNELKKSVRGSRGRKNGAGARTGLLRSRGRVQIGEGIAREKKRSRSADRPPT